MRSISSFFFLSSLDTRVRLLLLPNFKHIIDAVSSVGSARINYRFQVYDFGSLVQSLVCLSDDVSDCRQECAVTEMVPRESSEKQRATERCSKNNVQS